MGSGEGFPLFIFREYIRVELSCECLDLGHFFCFLRTQQRRKWVSRWCVEGGREERGKLAALDACCGAVLWCETGDQRKGARDDNQLWGAAGLEKASSGMVQCGLISQSILQPQGQGIRTWHKACPQSAGHKELQALS